MAEATPPIDNPELLTWEDACNHGDWTGLLVGNGASIAFWEDFKYDSLYERSLSLLTDYALTPEDLALFDALQTKNFERVLASLKTAGIVGAALARNTDFLQARYESVQRALFEAVHSVHVPWGTRLNFDSSLTQIRDELATYRWVYSVNYDLLIYWAIMTQARARGFVDFFGTEISRLGRTAPSRPGIVATTPASSTCTAAYTYGATLEVQRSRRARPSRIS